MAAGQCAVAVMGAGPIAGIAPHPGFCVATPLGGVLELALRSPQLGNNPNKCRITKP